MIGALLGRLKILGQGVGFFCIGRAGLPATRSPSPTSRVTTEPAPVSAPSPTCTGATSEVFEPIATLRPIIVRFFCLPSKLHVIVPAPMLLPSPISVSPTYERWLTLTRDASFDFLISTKLPMCTRAASSDCARKCAYGPTVQSSPMHESITTLSRIVTRAPREALESLALGPRTQFSPARERRPIHVFG